MSNIRSIDMMFLDDIFEMGSGYVLSFSDRTFAQFFAEELNIDIDDAVYARNGTSKAKRLRCFLQTVDKPTVVRTLNALWEYREALRQRDDKDESIKNAHGRLLALINRLEGRTDKTATSKPPPIPAFDCSGSINPDTRLGGNLTTLNEVFHGKTTTFVFNRVQS